MELYLPTVLLRGIYLGLDEIVEDGEHRKEGKWQLCILYGSNACYSRY